MTHYFIVPGLGNSGSEHWQTWFERSGTNFTRIQQQEWDAPTCLDWVNTIDKAIAGYELSSVVMIGHSLGCSTIAHWALQTGKIIKGVMLVAPSDIESPVYDFPASGFTPIPLLRLPFKTIVVASNDDPWVSIARATYFSNCWGGELINIGNAGHINTASGYGAWPEGLSILKTLG